MLTVTNIFYITIPALSTIFAFIILFCRWAAVIAICCDSTCPWPKIYWRLVYHMRREPDDQVTRHLVNLHTLEDASLPRWQPVLSVRCLPADSKNILKMLQALYISAIVPSEFFMRLDQLYHSVNPLRAFNCF